MLSKKSLSILTSLFLLSGVAVKAAPKSQNSEAALASNLFGQASLEESFGTGAPVDLSVANEEKIIEMLKKEGKIAKAASYEEARKVFLEYMSAAAKANKAIKLTKAEKELAAKQNQKVQKLKFEPKSTDTTPKKVKVLALLVDYQDYKHNSIQPDESDMYYADYSHKHFEDMIFGNNGYVGPNGENFVSMKQYYAEQSGGSLVIEGKVAGWYTLPGTAAYYGAETATSNDARPRNAVAHALQLAAKDPSISFADFDKEDLYDLDGDGNYNEPDGIIDHLMVLHAGVGQEAGGGSLGDDAIWSHRWNLGGLYKIPGTSYYAYDYTMEPEDGAAGVFAHEFGHDLGLPDEYDTDYSSATSEPISSWSIMSSGSWAGTVPGTEPTGFSPYAKEYFQDVYGGNWQNQITLDLATITKAGARVNLKQSSESGQVVRINLPNKTHVITTPTSGKYAYFSTSGDELDTSMVTTLDLTSATSSKLNFKTWYDIEKDWDYASIQVKEEGTPNWSTIPGNITTTENPNEQNPGNGITGTSNGWIDAEFDLTQFAGKKVDLKFNYWTDVAATQNGLYVDDITVTADGNILLSDDAEGTSKFTLAGFEKSTGTVYAPHYYLVEWRNHHGVDKGLAHVSSLGQAVPYDPGMVVWYVNSYLSDNKTGVHPGEGFLSVIDADQKNLTWKFADGTTPPMFASNKYQMRDAAFSKNKEVAFTVDLTATHGRSVTDNYRFTEASFDDGTDYSNPELSTVGVKIPSYGLKIQITNQPKDNSSASITIKK